MALSLLRSRSVLPAGQSTIRERSGRARFLEYARHDGVSGFIQDGALDAGQPETKQRQHFFLLLLHVLEGIKNGVNKRDTPR